MAITRPDFFLAGAPKSGSTSLYQYLDQHPQIYMSPVKEPTFFGREDLLSGWWRERTLQQIEKERPVLRAYLEGPMTEPKWLLVLDQDDYGKLFRGVRDEAAVGEASVSYYWMPSSAAAIRSAIPDARLIFVLRDPAEMAFSMYLAGLAYYPARTFREFFRASADPADMWHEVMEAPRHATNLARFFQLFPRERIRIYLYEDYVADPSGMLRDIFTFLGVDPEWTVDLSRRYNEPALPRLPALLRLRQRMFGDRPVRQMLPAWLRPALQKLYRSSRREVRMEPADRRMVIDHYREETERAADLIGRDLSAWLR